MARTNSVTNLSVIDPVLFGNALINDTVSQTDTADQACASNLNFASGKRPVFQGGAMPFVTVGTDAGCDYDTLQEAVDTDPSKTIMLMNESFAGAQIQNDTPLHIVGCGTDSTFIDVGTGANAKCIEVLDSTNYPYWGKFVTLENLTLIADAGYGIHCDLTAHGTSGHNGNVTPWFTLNNVNFGQHASRGCKWGMKINQPYRMTTYNTKFFNEAGVAGCAMWFTNTNPNSWHAGNSSFFSTFYENSGSGDGVFFDATGAEGANLNLMNFYKLEVQGGTNAVHLKNDDSAKGNVDHIKIMGLNAENVTNVVNIEGDNTRGAPWYANTTDCLFDLDYCHGNILATGTLGNIEFKGALDGTIDLSGANTWGGGLVIFNNFNPDATTLGAEITAVYIGGKYEGFCLKDATTGLMRKLVSTNGVVTSAVI
jgi:hypothetical protein